MSEHDVQHAKVIRLRAGDAVEMVDTAGAVWEARMSAENRVTVDTCIADAALEVEVELIAGILTGQQWDQLLDGAVQSGATSIIPLAAREKDADRIRTRADRSRRVVEAASRQSKRRSIPIVHEPATIDEILAGAPGFVCVEWLDHTMSIDEVVRSNPQLDARLLIGPAAGIDHDDASRLISCGWVPVTLGPTIFRAETAATVAVAMLRLARLS